MNDDAADVDDHDGLKELASLYMQAVHDLTNNRLDQAEDTLRDIVRREPRLPEPQLTLGRLLLDTARLEDAEERSRLALELLMASGPWTDEVEPHVVLSIAHAQLAEVLRQRVDEDDIVFGDPEQYKRMVAESREHFTKAAELDPSDETASFYAFYMKDPEAMAQVEGAAAAAAYEGVEEAD